MGVLKTLLSTALADRLYAAAAVGVVVHNSLFIKGEWHEYAPLLFFGHIGLAIAITALDSSVMSRSVLDAALDTLAVLSSYAAAIFASMAVYRIFFHRLRSFPGPPLAKVTKLWHAAYCLDSQNHVLMNNLYKQYGPFVRTGPTELAIFHPDIMNVTDGPKNTCTKAVWYDMMTPEMSVVSVRGKAEHDWRRRIWERGFGPKSMEQYDQRVLHFLSQFMTKVSGAADQKVSVNFTELMYWFGWDVMGDIVFGKSFGMLEHGRWHIAIIMLKRAMRLLGPITPVPWLAKIGFKLIPGLWVVKDWFDMIEFCRQQMRQRINITDSESRANISSHLIKDAQKNGFREIDGNWLTGDSVLAIVAGSDTVVATLVCLFYRLAQDPTRAEKIYEELGDIDTRDHKALSSLPYLTAVINETLRLHPPLPTGGLRESGPDGIYVGDTYVPGNTTIVAPKWCLGRLENAFAEAESFIPERWTDRPEMVRDHRAFRPFGLGRYGCIGKGLAWAEMRVVVATVVRDFHVAFAPGEDGRRVDAEMRDYFTPAPGRLDLVFSRRCDTAKSSAVTAGAC